MYKNIEKQKALRLKDLVEYQKGQVISRTLVQNEQVRSEERRVGKECM